MLLSEHLNSSNLKSFSINGLFGYKDVKIPFDKEAVILIAENGSGKTTILNALYYAISCKFSRLISIDFESIVLEFVSEVSVEIKKSDLIKFRSNKASIKKEDEDKHRILLHWINENDSSSAVFDEDEDQEMTSTINNNINASVLYFPTYRRIEEELKNLGHKELHFRKRGKTDDQLIQFGMDDVIAKFDEIQKNIKDATLELLPKVNGEMLTQFVEVTTPTQEMRNSIQPETLNIVLSRIGNNIPENDKNKIEELVNSGKIKSPQYDQLVYYLSKLLGLYEPQKEKDNSIKKFAEVCNKYLHKKRIVYDETSVKISIVQERNNQPIDIRNLSSGEKQIISLFSKIYLDSDDEYIILFDEPELSLSLEWQRFLLPDILKSGKCKLLLAVTHSPFIFDNELDTNAIDLDDFITEK
ncbi:AAA family ATPase [Anabaena cylindrica FACHB-243]|uniref:AAA ATPase n=1 Tax=Anabaena cylindrica (strain ATCC 27899 / PCC 7122) TaxID=272123 RepID=K9ZE11_ANACC|nr:MULTISPECIES: AAA family ATPase [Anabaena]AFZ56605.1 AAA ATPase [Anabaena cylindrica PCC 7122]MBD2416223.1 AAA family ATPase [Anabaena cylindrica FACHB-243]MBY5285336.1 ATP-binding protein [Anabaena sp. CCAP 1446/1C]MBY5310785.1 ATP-binding protein [Anabaena sp. CCAP 1446/1C]MCM2408898.1 ATP-binding protein [Anabaena sp. CCAP 1446/1C]